MNDVSAVARSGEMDVARPVMSVGKEGGARELTNPKLAGEGFLAAGSHTCEPRG